jgi:hypothetical protein
MTGSDYGNIELLGETHGGRKPLIAILASGVGPDEKAIG